MKDLTPEQILQKRWEIIEQIQGSLICAGGSFMSRQQIEKMNFGDFLSFILPNYIKMKIEYDSEAYVKAQKD